MPVVGSNSKPTVSAYNDPDLQNAANSMSSRSPVSPIARGANHLCRHATAACAG